MKIIGEVESTCPGCKQKSKQEAEIDLDKLEIQKLEIPKMNNMTVSPTSGSASTTTTVYAPQPEVKIKEVQKIPSHIPKFKCKNCTENHKNKDYAGIKYKCVNCGQFSASDGSCVFCDNKEFDEITDEELEELGIELPEQKEHNHELEDK